MFRRRPQNGLKENIIMKQRNEKQAWAHSRLDKNSRSNYSLLDHFHNEPVLRKVEVDMLLVLNEFRKKKTKLRKPSFIVCQIRKTK